VKALSHMEERILPRSGWTAKRGVDMSFLGITWTPASLFSWRLWSLLQAGRAVQRAAVAWILHLCELPPLPGFLQALRVQPEAKIRWCSQLGIDAVEKEGLLQRQILLLNCRWTKEAVDRKAGRQGN